MSSKKKPAIAAPATAQVHARVTSVDNASGTKYRIVNGFCAAPDKANKRVSTRTSTHK
jgi:hypothetical protein